MEQDFRFLNNFLFNVNCGVGPPVRARVGVMFAGHALYCWQALTMANEHKPKSNTTFEWSVPETRSFCNVILTHSTLSKGPLHSVQIQQHPKRTNNHQVALSQHTHTQYGLRQRVQAFVSQQIQNVNLFNFGHVCFVAHTTKQYK